ncbi:Glycerophosphoryl diester phosphodiesterase [metagenome]|uniref:Glycerophosphoryl diester phosphodiesterase n=1 Tax=metagenome TaxID=256318 RepID=A0A2P2CDM8_9ZZZZ
MSVLNALVTPPLTGCAYLDDPGPVLAFAHRGGARHSEIDGLENTLTAFRHAVGLGYRYLETDVHVTSDGVLLAFHDDVLDRVTDQVGAIATLSFAKVRRAVIGGRETVPTMADVLDACPDARFNIDLKSDAAVRPLVDLLRERGLEDEVLVGSWGLRRLQRFRRLTGGRIATSAAPVEVVLFVLLPGRIADLLTRGRVSALQIPHRFGLVTLAAPWFIRRVHAAGKHVHVWTIDDADEMDLLLDRGVDGLMTDRTDILKAVLQRRSLWREA